MGEMRSADSLTWINGGLADPKQSSIVSLLLLNNEDQGETRTSGFCRESKGVVQGGFNR
jgi:hypothetical protein